MMPLRSLSARLALLLLPLAAPLATAQERQPVRVAIVLFEGVQIIDFSGPWETFGQAGYRVFSVAESRKELGASMGLRVVPEHAFGEAPEADILVVPGGALPHRLEREHPVAAWVRERAPRARYVLTVCNGAFVLGAAGLAEGRALTTTAGMIGHLEQFLPGATAVYDRRFVHDGKVVSAGGLTAGIDAALYLIGEIDSRGRAREVANKMEYDWDPESGYARSKLADCELYRALDLAPPLRKKVLRYEGDERRWTADFLVRRPCTLAGFADELARSADALGWTDAGERRAEREIELAWTYANHRGEPWHLAARFEATPKPDEHRLVIELERQ